MRNKLAAFFRQLGPETTGMHLVCAISGGADSVAMSHCLLSLREELGYTLSLCHYNHGLRGEASDGDEAFCRSLAETWDIPITVGRGDAALRASQTGESLEEAARFCRYGFFDTVDGIIATAHTADDQAETVLLHLLRGTGLKGLCGIPPTRGRILRPMLAVSREEVLAYLDAHNLPHREDATNHEDDCLRNRLRHHVMPLLKQENPALLAAVTRMTEHLRQDETYLQTQAIALLVGNAEQGWQIAPLAAADTPLRRRALKELLFSLSVPDPSTAHIEAAEHIVQGVDPSAAVNLTGGWVLRREYETFFVEQNPQSATFVPQVLPCPGNVTVPELGLTFRCAEDRGGDILIRPRKQGDEIRLAGGTKSVKKLLIDKKIPVNNRELVPVLEENGVVIALWGVATATNTDITAITAEKERGTGI